MTSTKHRKTVRKTTAQVRDRGKSRDVVVTLQGDWIDLRLLGTRQSFRVNAGAMYAMAVYNFVLENKARKKAERAAKRKAKRR